MPAKMSSTCPHCQIGNLHPTAETYSMVFGSSVLSAPNIPAWRCDICSYLEYDEDALMRLDLLIGELDTRAESARSSARHQQLDAEVSGSKPAPRLKPS
jgi:hypothetical protein